MKRILLLSFSLAFSQTFACTHFRLTAKDSSVVVGRSMEFAQNLETDIYTVNRETSFNSKTPDGKAGLTWEAKYGYLALNGFHLFPVSGINEKGLSFDALYLPGLATYQPYDASHSESAMPYYQIADYILGNFNTIDEVKARLPQVQIYGKPLKHAGKSVIFPLHFVVTDKAGKGVIIEYIDGKLNLYDDKAGVLTNSPNYPWQTTNLSNYVNLSPYSPDPIVNDGVTYNATGQGGGAVGLPGDYSPPSRFVKTAYLVGTSKPADNALKVVNLSAHILNNVDIPYGAVRGSKKSSATDDVDYTQWIVIKDLTHQILYFRSYTNLNLQKVEMSKLSFEKSSPKHSMPLQNNQAHIRDATW